MLAIRMQRTGRKGHAMFRMVVQDSRRTPSSGKVVAQLGSYDPHAKTVILQKDKAVFYLEHGAQPSTRVAAILAGQGVTLPDWVKKHSIQKRTTRKPDKLRKNRPESEKPAADTAVVSPKTIESTPTTEVDSPEVKETETSEQPATAEPSSEEQHTPTDAQPSAAEDLPDDNKEK